VPNYRKALRIGGLFSFQAERKREKTPRPNNVRGYSQRKDIYY